LFLLIITIDFYLLWLREARKRLALAETSVITRSNFVAGTAGTIIAFARAESVEQSRQVDPRQINQVTTGTAVIIAAGNIARTAIGDDIARTAIGGASTTKTDVSERIQVPKRKLARSAEINFSARIAVDYAIAWTAVCRIVTRSAQRRCKQISQASAQSRAGTADFVAWTACNLIAGVASKNCVARATVTDSDSVDQSLETRKQVAASGGIPVTCSTRVNACRITGVCIASDTQQ